MIFRQDFLLYLEKHTVYVYIYIYTYDLYLGDEALLRHYGFTRVRGFDHQSGHLMTTELGDTFMEIKGDFLHKSPTNGKS